MVRHKDEPGFGRTLDDTEHRENLDKFENFLHDLNIFVDKAIQTKSFQICQKARTVLLQKLHANHYLILRLEDKMVRMEEEAHLVAPLIDHVISVRQMLDPCFPKTKAYCSLKSILTANKLPSGS